MKAVLSKLNVRRGYLVLGLLVLALALSACASQDGGGQLNTASTPGANAEPTDGLGLGEPGADTTAEPAATMPAADATPIATDAMGAAGSTPTAGETPGAGMADEAATVQLTDNDVYGEILTDGEGMTLYLFTKDTPNTSNCYDQCATNWPPLLTAGEPQGGEGVDAGLLGVTERTDGTQQVTYNGWPLYYWVNDKEPGDTDGQGVGDVWYVVSPEGEMIEAGGE